MSNVQPSQPPGAAPQPPPGRLGALKLRVDGIGGMITALAGIGGILAAGAATLGGGVQATYDWVSSATETKAQQTAQGERLTAVEGQVKTILEADLERDHLTKAALERQIEEASRVGADVSDLKSRLRSVELNMARQGAQLEVLMSRSDR